MEDIIVIIRAAGERTEKLCKQLILEQGIAKESVKMIHEVPFSAALKKSYELGIESEKKWTFCIDADILLRPGSIDRMIELAEEKSENISEIQGFMLDKFFGGIRRGGVHLYRSSLLPMALNNIPADGDAIRPETQTLQNLKKLGYPRAMVPYIVGIHDDEQYYSDIFRKSFVHGVKHTQRIPLFLEIWRKNARDDEDFNVALHGLAESIINREQLFIDASQGIYKEKFEEAGFKEKPELNLNEYNISNIEEKIRNWIYDDIYHKFFPDKDGYLLSHQSFLKKFKAIAGDKGFSYALMLALGTLLNKSGGYIKKKIG